MLSEARPQDRRELLTIILPQVQGLTEEDRKRFEQMCTAPTPWQQRNIRRSMATKPVST